MKTWMRALMVTTLAMSLSLPAMQGGMAMAAAQTTKWPQTFDSDFVNQAKNGLLRGCNVHLGDTREQVRKAFGMPLQHGGDVGQEWERYTDCELMYSAEQRVIGIYSPGALSADAQANAFTSLTVAGVETLLGKPKTTDGAKRTYEYGRVEVGFTVRGNDAVGSVYVGVPAAVVAEDAKKPGIPKAATRIFVDDKLISLPTPPVEKENRLLVPLRVLESLGATVSWEESTQTAYVRYGDQTVKFAIGSNLMEKKRANESVFSGTRIDGPPAQLINDRTMVPLRAVSESIGAFVGWVGRDTAAYLYSPVVDQLTAPGTTNPGTTNPTTPPTTVPPVTPDTTQSLPQTKVNGDVSVTVTGMEMLATETIFTVRIDNNGPQSTYILAGLSTMTSGGKKIKHQGANLDPNLVGSVEPNKSQVGYIAIPGRPSGSSSLVLALKLYNTNGMLEFAIAY